MERSIGGFIVFERVEGSHRALVGCWFDRSFRVNFGEINLGGFSFNGWGSRNKVYLHRFWGDRQYRRWKENLILGRVDQRPSDELGLGCLYYRRFSWSHSSFSNRFGSFFLDELGNFQFRRVPRWGYRFQVDNLAGGFRLSSFSFGRRCYRKLVAKGFSFEKLFRLFGDRVLITLRFFSQRRIFTQSNQLRFRSHNPRFFRDLTLLVFF